MRPFARYYSCVIIACLAGRHIRFNERLKWIIIILKAIGLFSSGMRVKVWVGDRGKYKKHSCFNTCGVIEIEVGRQCGYKF